MPCMDRGVRYMITRIYIGAPKNPAPAGTIQALERELVDQVGGFTAFAGTGVWKGPDGIVEELAYVYEIVHEGKPVQNMAIYAFASQMKELLNQEEVLMV